MIWIYWHIFIIAESLAHWYVIEEICYDLTPDAKLITLSKALVISARGAAFFLLWWQLGIHQNLEMLFFTTGCLFSHLLWFPILLNAWRGKTFDYLGKGITDKILALPGTLARLFWLAVLVSSSIYTYYNTDLL